MGIQTRPSDGDRVAIGRTEELKCSYVQRPRGFSPGTASMRLGWEEIDCIFVDMDDVDLPVMTHRTANVLVKAP